MEINTAQGKKLNDTVMSMLQNYSGVHHAYKDNFYSSMNLGKNLSKDRIRVCGTLEA
jgi:hypothetical protein